MFSIERKIIEFMEKKKNFIFLAVITFLAAFVRYAGRKFISCDMMISLEPWYEEIWENGGLSALKSQVGDYNIIYQTLIALMTYLPISSMYAYKMLSIAFDFLLALATAFLVCELTQKEKFGYTFCIAYAVTLFLPTNILNSAYWGQCDSIYTFFVILTILYLCKEKYVRAFVFMGLAFAFKLQTIFILPFIICYYVYKKKFSLLYFGISIATFWASGIIAYIYGRNILAPFLIYANQTVEYPVMYSNIPSFWMLVGNNYDVLQPWAITAVLVLCGMGLYAVLSGRKKMDSAEQYMNTLTWFVWTCVFFLPSMHERYTYPLDILLIITSFTNKKYAKYAAFSSVMSLITYGIILFNNGSLDKVYSLLYVVAWLHYTCFVLKTENPDSASPCAA